MNTLEQLQALTDEQLIEKVAVEVMGWEKRDARDPRDVWLWFDKNESRWHPKASRQWNPLTDWNHTMEVVERMFDLGYERPLPDGRQANPPGHPWLSMTTNNTRGWLVNFHWQTPETFHQDGRRAICLAALLTV